MPKDWVDVDEKDEYLIDYLFDLNEMQRLRITFGIFIVFFALTKVAAASDEKEIIAIMHAHIASINNEESDAIALHHLPGHNEFGATGGQLGLSGSFAEQQARNQEIFGSGFKFNWKLKDLKVQVFDNAAIVTGYVVGTTTSPDGTVTSINNRRTTVLIKQQGQWKEIHVHNSPLKDKN